MTHRQYDFSSTIGGNRPSKPDRPKPSLLGPVLIAKADGLREERRRRSFWRLRKSTTDLADLLHAEQYQIMFFLHFR